MWRKDGGPTMSTALSTFGVSMAQAGGNNRISQSGGPAGI